jgi:hypothetical protein
MTTRKDVEAHAEDVAWWEAMVERTAREGNAMGLEVAQDNLAVARALLRATQRDWELTQQAHPELETQS